jgi:hypothetical protein
LDLANAREPFRERRDCLIKLNGSKDTQDDLHPNKLGHSLSQISELTGLTSDEVKERLGQATGLTPEALSSILHMKQRGLSLELISQELDVELGVLEQFLPPVIKKTVETHALADQDPYEISLSQRAYTLSSPDHCKTYSRSPTTTEEAKHPSQPITATLNPQHSHTPTFLYSGHWEFNWLERVNLLTGEESYHHEEPRFQFKEACRLSELPGGRLLLTGGTWEGVREVMKIDTLREYAVSSQPPMHTARRSHAAVYHSQYLYVLGGLYKRCLSKCERYSCSQSRWEVLPALPVADYGMSAVEVENSLYVLRGRTSIYLDNVQKLSLDSLTWDLMQLKLPRAACYFPCFKTDSQVYLVSRGTLYYERGSGIRSLAVGELLGFKSRPP